MLGEDAEKRVSVLCERTLRSRRESSSISKRLEEDVVVDALSNEDGPTTVLSTELGQGLVSIASSMGNLLPRT